MRSVRMLTAVVAGAVIGLGACKSLGSKAFQEPVVTVKNVTITGLGLTGGTVEVNLTVHNPNGFALDAQRLTYQFFVDSTRFGQGATEERFHVGARDSSVVRLPLDFNWSGVGSVGRDLLNRGSVNYRVAGDLTVGSGLGNYTLKYDRNGRFSPMGSRP